MIWACGEFTVADRYPRTSLLSLSLLPIRLTEWTLQPSPNLLGNASPPRYIGLPEICPFLSIITRPAALNLRRCHLTCPDDPIVFDPVMRLAWVVPVSNRGTEGNRPTIFAQIIFSLFDRRNNFRPAPAGTLVARSPVFSRNVKSPICQLAWDEVDVFRVHGVQLHTRSSFVS